jgi:hypothetical protein
MKKEPDALLQTTPPFRGDYQPKTLVVLETAVWNETVKQLANEVKMWKDSGMLMARIAVHCAFVDQLRLLDFYRGKDPKAYSSERIRSYDLPVRGL